MSSLKARNCGLLNVALSELPRKAEVFRGSHKTKANIFSTVEALFYPSQKCIFLNHLLGMVFRVTDILFLALHSELFSMIL